MTYTARHIIGLPYKAINTLLSLGLEHDTVHLSKKAIRHMRERHPKDYALCIDSMDAIITAPDFIGQEPHHPDSFEVVKHIGSVIVLAAISVIQNEYGKYPVESSYLIEHNTFRRRI